MTGIYLTLIDDDRDWFEELYDNQHVKLIRLAYGILNDYQSAEDAVSEVYLHVALKFGKLRKMTQNELRRYCSAAVRNKCTDILKSEPLKSYYENRISENVSAADEELKYVNSMYLREKIDMLSYDDKEILVLYYYYGFNLREISDFKKISNEAAKKRIQSARSRLKKEFDVDYIYS